MYVGKSTDNLDTFVEAKYVNPDMIYLNCDMSLYKTLKLNKPGMLACYGMCSKAYYKKKKELIAKHPVVKGGVPQTNEKNFQLGGSLLINNKGRKVYVHRMNYVGDHANPETIINSVKNYFGFMLKPKILSINKNAVTEIHEKIANNIKKDKKETDDDNLNSSIKLDSKKEMSAKNSKKKSFKFLKNIMLECNQKDNECTIPEDKREYNSKTPNLRNSNSNIKYISNNNEEKSNNKNNEDSIYKETPKKTTGLLNYLRSKTSSIFGRNSSINYENKESDNQIKLSRNRKESKEDKIFYSDRTNLYHNNNEETSMKTGNIIVLDNSSNNNAINNINHNHHINPYNKDNKENTINEDPNSSNIHNFENKEYGTLNINISTSRSTVKL